MRRYAAEVLWSSEATLMCGKRLWSRRQSRCLSGQSSKIKPFYAILILKPMILGYPHFRKAPLGLRVWAGSERGIWGKPSGAELRDWGSIWVQRSSVGYTHVEGWSSIHERRFICLSPWQEIFILIMQIFPFVGLLGHTIYIHTYMRCFDHGTHESMLILIDVHGVLTMGIPRLWQQTRPRTLCWRWWCHDKWWVPSLESKAQTWRQGPPKHGALDGAGGSL